MITPLHLGNQKFPVNIIQGPLAGVSCAPFRRLNWEYSQPAFSCTEMISCNTLIYQPQKRYTYIDPNEGPVCFQLSGNNPVELAEATKFVTALGADLIDLNCGCPVNKIRRKGAGSSLLTNPLKLYQLIDAMKRNTHVPVSIKIRVQGNSDEKFNLEIAKVVRDAGADFLVVHRRHWTEHYETPCRHDEIEFFVKELSIPVIGNGDIACVDSLKRMLATGCSGVMIGRAGVGQPWLIRQLIAEIEGNPFIPLSLAKIGEIFLMHVLQLMELMGNEKFAILQSRTFAKYYARRLVNKREFGEAMNLCDSFSCLSKICNEYFIEMR